MSTTLVDIAAFISGLPLLAASLPQCWCGGGCCRHREGRRSRCRWWDWCRCGRGQCRGRDRCGDGSDSRHLWRYDLSSPCCHNSPTFYTYNDIIKHLINLHMSSFHTSYILTGQVPNPVLRAPWEPERGARSYGRGEQPCGEG